MRSMLEQVLTVDMEYEEVEDQHKHRLSCFQFERSPGHCNCVGKPSTKRVSFLFNKIIINFNEGQPRVYVKISQVITKQNI